MDYDIIISTLAATVRLTTPVLLACLAGLYSERSGVFDIGLEGKMLAGAFGAATVVGAYRQRVAWAARRDPRVRRDGADPRPSPRLR